MPLLRTEDHTVELDDLDAELARRFDWWPSMPEAERRVLAAALASEQKDLVAFAIKLGERRAYYGAWQVCYHVVEVRREDGSPVVDEEGEPMIVALWPGPLPAKRCACMRRALLDDELFAYAERHEDHIGRRSLVGYVAGELHRDPDFSIGDWIAAKESEAELRRLRAEVRAEPARPSGAPVPEPAAAESRPEQADSAPPPEEPEPAKPAEQPEQPQRRGATRPVHRSRRWYDRGESIADYRF